MKSKYNPKTTEISLNYNARMQKYDFALFELRGKERFQISSWHVGKSNLDETKIMAEEVFGN